MPGSPRDGASFRDPSGFLFTRDGTLYRQVNQSYRPTYDRLVESGLLEELTSEGRLIPHSAADVPPAEAETASLVIRPEPLAFVSYPYEWSFSQLQDAALATLEIQERALRRGFSLKDASAYNLQFHQGRPTLIDTLSFEVLPAGRPWVAYRQFCQHFLAPLAVMCRRDIRLGQLLRIHIDGIPLDLAASLLPWRSRLNPGLGLHLHLHAASQARFAGADVRRTRRQMSSAGLLGLLDSLRRTVASLHWDPGRTAWADYRDTHNYSPEAFEAKRAAVIEFLDRTQPSSVWDLGANTGDFSRLASDRGAFTVAFDLDPSAVEVNYLGVRARKETSLLPLLVDLANPSPAQGWHHRERRSLQERGPAEAVMALALVHHLAIGNNVPLPQVAEFLASLGRWLIVEFVPKSDGQVQRMLAARQDIFDDYHREGFEAAFGAFFRLEQAREIEGSERVLYLWEKRQDATS